MSSAGVPKLLVSGIEVMQGGVVHALYAPGVTAERVSGLLTVSAGLAAHFTKTRFPKPASLWAKATCVPSSEYTGEVRTDPPVL